MGKRDNPTVPRPRRPGRPRITRRNHRRSLSFHIVHPQIADDTCVDNELSVRRCRGLPVDYRIGNRSQSREYRMQNREVRPLCVSRRHHANRSAEEKKFSHESALQIILCAEPAADLRVADSLAAAAEAGTRLTPENVFCQDDVGEGVTKIAPDLSSSLCNVSYHQIETDRYAFASWSAMIIQPCGASGAK